mgnify:FL=1|jgi:hypothetical protein
MCLLSFVAGGLMVAGICAYRANKYQIETFLAKLRTKTKEMVDKVKPVDVPEYPAT